MSLSAWEQQALDSIKDGLAGSDPELAALLSAFTGLASGEKMPDKEEVRAGSRRALRRLRRARWRSSVRRMCLRLGLQRAALLLWLLTTAAIIAVALALNASGDHGTCTETLATVCADPALGHSWGPASRDTSSGQAPQQPAPVIPQAGP
jgi:Protein of unknown function (DUF3040)